MSIYSGLKFEKFDLHVHTPASHDFKNKSITADQIVEQALSKGMRGIAITDHNTGAFIAQMKDAAKGKNIAIFPGVEITCTGGEKGIHVIAILDVDKTEKHIEHILSTLKISPDDYGKKDAVTTLSPFEVAEIVGGSPNYGLVVLAHGTSSKGVLHDIKGATRKKIFTSKHLLAIESSHDDFINEEKKRAKTRALDLLSGQDENFNFRKLAVYISSDSKLTGVDDHSLDGICSKFTLFKVDEVVTLESLRQCFIDRDVRIRQHFEYAPIAYPYIKDITIRGGFFDGQKGYFHQGLNSILGGKGVGKSLLIELLRFALSQPSTQAVISDDHQRKLARRLQTYGSVSLSFVDETGKECQVTRQFNPSEGNPYANVDESAMAASFPVLFLSQNEIVKIAEDENEQMNFIDRFFDFKHYVNRINLLERDITKLDDAFASGLRAIGDLNELSKQATKLKNDLEKIDKLLKDPIYEKYKSVEAKNRHFEAQMNYIKTLQDKLETFTKEIELLRIPALEELVENDPQLKRGNDSIETGKRELLVSFETANKGLATIYSTIQKEYLSWGAKFAEEKAKYETYIRNAGGDKKELEAQRLKIVKEMGELTKKEVKLQGERENLKNIVKEREGLIKKLFSIYDEYSAERSAKCAKFVEVSNERLTIKIETASNKDEFRRRLLEMKKGSYLRDADIDAICNSMSPYEFIIELLRYQASSDPKTLTKLHGQIEMDFNKLQVLCDFLLSQIKFEDLMKLQYKAKPQDKPEIKFRLSNDDYELIRDISVGQKCTAMLIMCLSDGKFPIIIDQPEDSLDVRSVWEDMCTKIRKGKESRQFVFTTHNSCLAVASDTDKYMIIESDATTGQIVKSGALDDKDLKEEVIKYLEGGRKTYNTKAEKYGSMNE